MEAIAFTQKIPASPSETSRRRSFLRDDFPVIERASIVFVLCAIISAILIAGSQFLLDSQLEAVQHFQAHARKTKELFDQVTIEKNEIQTFQPKYGQLLNQGFIGPEKRLDWIESIQSIQKTADLMPINYEIAEQQSFQLDPSIDAGSLALHGSKMTVKINLLHEMDLINFLDGLKAHQVIDLQNCFIKRLAVTDTVNVTPRLSAECTLYWITLDKK